MSVVELNKAYLNLTNDEKSWVDNEAEEDYRIITERIDGIVSGFLDIGEKDGWTDGGHPLTALHFVRFMLRKFWVENSSKYSDYSDIFERVIRSISPSVLKGNLAGDKSPRAYMDPSIKGWYRHAISRYVGNLSMKFRPDGPFFEVLINSARTSAYNPNCFPFSVTIYHNKEAIEDRYQLLQTVQKLDGKIAYNAYYNSSLFDPQKFLAVYGVRLGPNSSRLLGGLAFLNRKQIQAQSVGNCWMKQPKRGVLLSLFIETLTCRPEFNYNQAWKVADRFYKKWKKATIQEIQKIYETHTGFSIDLKMIVEKKIAELDSLK